MKTESKKIYRWLLVPLLILPFIFFVMGSKTVDEHAHHRDSGEQAAHEYFQQESETLRYICPMHPHIHSENPDDRCPICNMQLVPAGSEQQVRDDSNDDERIAFSGRRLALLDVQTVPVRRGMAMASLRVAGRLDYDEREQKTVSAWLDGRIEQLHVNYIGAHVKKGQALMDIYSPQLLVAQQELLQATRQLEQAGEKSIMRDSLQSNIEAARERLRQLGLNSQQMDDVIKHGKASDRVEIKAPASGTVISRHVSEGGYVTTGDALLSIADLQSLWAVLDVYEKDLPGIGIGDRVNVQLSASPEQKYEGEIVSFSPRIDAVTRSRELRVRLDNKDEKLVPGSFVNATIGQHLHNVLLIPGSAPLLTGERTLVYIKTGEGEFSPRQINLGQRVGDEYQVLDGLVAGEIIVSRGAFRIDSELQIRGKPSMMAPEGGGAAGHDHGQGDSGGEAHDHD